MERQTAKLLRPHRVVMVAFDGVELLDVVGPLETFANAADFTDTPQAYTVEIAAGWAGPVRASSGLVLNATLDYRAIAGADTVLIAGGTGVEEAARDLALRDALREAAIRRRRIGSVCTGAFVLAAAGLLDGRRAATHWKYCARLAERFPAVTVEPDPIFIADRGIWTSAGVTAGIDLALAMIEQDQGPKVAIRTAQELVMFRRRPGGQSQFSAELQLQATPHRPMQDLQGWILENLTGDLSVEALAERMAMSERNFARVFRRETGMTPARFVEQARLQKAREMLELGSASVEAVAFACGYQSADVLARALMRRLGVAPLDYRRRFGAIWNHVPNGDSPMESSMPTPDAEISALVRARTLDVAILLFPDVEVLDFAGPFEVFSVASRIHRGTEHRPFRVSTVAAERIPVPARHGLPVIANYTFAEQPRADVLIVPGGIVDQPLGDPKTLAWLAATAKEAVLTASVCTGAFLLATIGLLQGRAVTTHWEDIPELRAAHPDINVVENVPYVDEGRIVTSAGISAGIDMSLHLVARILGDPAAQATARQMQYDWSEAREAA